MSYLAVFCMFRLLIIFLQKFLELKIYFYRPSRIGQTLFLTFLTSILRANRRKLFLHMKLLKAFIFQHALNLKLFIIKDTLCQFQNSHKTCLCTVNFYRPVLQSNSFNYNDLIVLLNWGWSRLMNKLSLIRSLTLFASEARISKQLKSI